MAKPNELYHHGVLGMKWGKKNGPPYPLDAQGKAQLREQKKIENKKIKEETKKITFKDYNDQDKHRLAKNTAIGAVIGGPVLGIAVGLITDNSIRKGKAIANLYSDKKVSELIDKKHTDPNKKLTTDQINEIGKEILKTNDKDLTDEAMIKMIETQKRKNADKIAAKYERNTEVVESYTKSARESIKNGDYKKAANTIAQIPYDHFVSETNRLVSEGKSDDEATSIVLSGDTKHGVHPTERLAFDSAEKILSEIKDSKNREEFLSELSVSMDASQRDNPSVMVYNNNQRKITSYYDTYTVDNELKKNGLNATGDYNATDLDVIYKSKQRGANSYYIWGRKVQ